MPDFVPLPTEDERLARFDVHDELRPHLAWVMAALPEAVRDDLLNDPNFWLGDYDPTATTTLIPVAAPSRGRPGRSVLLKRTLRRRPVAFIRWLIAHELAHAYLRNVSGGPEHWTDVERAADELAARWGFARPE